MKKTLLTFSIIIASLLTTVAQISFSHKDIVLGDGDTVVAYVDPLLTTFLEFKITVHNDTDNGMNLKVAREVISELAPFQNNFCWGGACYPPALDTSNKYQFIHAQSHTSGEEDLSSDYLTNGLVGYSIVKYNFYDINAPEVNATIVVKFWASPAGIAEEAMNGGSISDIYPNPATTNISLDYQLTSKVHSAQVKVFNVLGAVVKEADLQIGSNKHSLDIQDLTNGIYFYSILINGDIYTTKKMVVRK